MFYEATFQDPAANNHQTFQTLYSKISTMVWKSMRIAVVCTYEAAATVGAFFVAGVALRIFFPFMGPPFFGIGTTLLATRFAVKILNVYNVELLKTIKDEACF